MKSTMRLVEVWMAVGALSVVVLLVQGSNAYRLQQQKMRDSSSSKGAGLTNVEKSKSLVGGSTGTGIISSGGGSKKASGGGPGGGGGGGEVSVWPPRLPMWGFLPQSSSSSSSHSSSSHQQIKSKSESSKEEGEEEDNNSHTHHHSSSTFLDEDDEPWLSHLKRSSGGGGGVKRTRNYDVPQIGKKK